MHPGGWITGGHGVTDGWEDVRLVVASSAWHTVPVHLGGSIACAGYLIVTGWRVGNWFAVAVGLLTVVGALWVAWLGSRLRLVVSAAGLERQSRRLGYTCRVGWAEIDGVQVERLRWRLGRGLVLTFPTRQLEPLRPDGAVSETAQARARGRAIDRRWALSPFFGGTARQDFVGELARRRPDLAREVESLLHQRAAPNT